MQGKDFMLLMIMPLILVSIVFYINENPTITAAAISQQHPQNEIIGAYLTMTSFKIKNYFDMNDYFSVKKSLDKMSSCAQNGQDIQSCILQTNTKDNPFEFSLGCDKGLEKVMYDFAEFLQDCIDSYDNNCLCTKNMDIKKEDVQEYLPPAKRFAFTLIEDPSSKKIDINSKSSDASYSVKTNGISGWIPTVYSLGFSSGSLDFNLFFTKIFGQLSVDDKKIYGGDPNDDQNTYGFGSLKQIHIFKNDIKGKTAIDFVKLEGDTMLYPNKDIVKDKNSQAINVKSLSTCSIQPKNIAKFCATKKDYKIMAYDKLDGQVKERPLVIKFASYIPIIPPPPLTPDAFDKLKDDKSIILRWDKSPKEDRTKSIKYNIYYGKSELNLFEGLLDDIKKKNGLSKKELDPNNAVEINQINLKNCNSELGKKCTYDSLPKTAIEKDKLYHVKDLLNDYYFYSVSIEDNIAYDFAVTALDNNGNEIDNVKQKLNVLRNIQSSDDLPLDSTGIVAIQSYDSQFQKVSFNFAVPSKNIDGSNSNDFNEYGIYYMKYALLTEEDKIKAANILLDSKISDKGEVGVPKLLAKLRLEQAGQPIDIASTNPQKDNTYIFFAVASDKAGNPQSNQFRFKDVGASPMQLEIP